MIRVAYFSTTTFLVFQILTGFDLSGFPEPEEDATSALLLNDELQMPLYFDGTEFQAQPPSPDPEYIWDPALSDWVTDVYTSIKYFKDQVNEALIGYDYLGFGYRPPGETDLLFVHIDDWTRRRIQAMTNKLALDQTDPLPVTVFGEDESGDFDQIREIVVTRAQGAEFCLLYAEHNEKLAMLREFVLIQLRAIENLAHTDPVQAAADLLALRMNEDLFWEPVTN